MSRKVERIFREPRFTRGNTGVTRIQPIDHAHWVWHPALVDELPGLKPRVVRFRTAFEALPEPLVFDVSADERFVLMVDGEIVSRGPNRGLVENWQYHTYRAELAPGPHAIEAVCWTIGEAAPLAQLSWKGGFVFAAEGGYDEILTTGKGRWQVGLVEGLSVLPPTPGSNAWGTGSSFQVEGDGPLHALPAEWVAPVSVRPPVRNDGKALHCGGRSRGWMLFPTQLPDQIERPVSPGRFRAASETRTEAEDGEATVVGDGLVRKMVRTAAAKPYFYTEDDGRNPYVARFDALAKNAAPLEIPPNSFVRALWDIDDYYGVYPDVGTSGGAGAKVTLLFHESLQGSDGFKRDRDAFVGKHLWGYGDVFLPDGRADARFTTLWWRTGRWAEITVETGDAPLTLTRLSLVESRYPLERESAFACDDTTMDGIQKICLRAMQMCCHEMLFDCPFYEQQMYPGDTRIQLLVLSALSRDERMIRRAIEIFDLAARDDGMVPFNYPTRGTQEGGSYTLCWLLMFGDYVMWHDNVDWLRARVPGMRHTLSGLACYEDADGILCNLPGWNFLDWVADVPYTKTMSWAPGSLVDDTERGSILSLFWVLALQSAAKVERALGDEAMARYWEAKAKRTGESIVRIFWDEKNAMLADTDTFSHYSEHALSLAIIAGILPPDKRAAAAKALVERDGIARATVYFSHYLFQAYFAIGRGDLFLKRLDLWRGYVAKGLRTTQEAPDSGKNGQRESRSDCHAWGAHPLFWLQDGTAGVSPAAPFFREVRVAPQPGPLSFVKARVPHPRGFVEVDLRFADGAASGTVTLPDGVPGTFAFGGREVALHAGANEI